jgi:hypothetical protein
MSSVSTLVDQLKTAQGAALQKLLYELAVQLSGDTSDALRAELRKIGAVAVISKLLTHEAKQIHQLAINIAGSLAATALDPQAGLSNSLLKQAGAFDHLLRHLLTTKDDTTLLYALIAIQNMCVEIEYVNELKAAGGIKRLQHIVGQADPQLRQFAQGCLDNARTVVAIDAMQQKAVKSTPKTRAEAGKYLAHAYVRRWRARRAATVTGASDLSAGVDASKILDERQHAHTAADGEDLQDVQLAITTLQSVLRGKQKRAELERTKKEKIAAQRLQRVLRGHQARGVASAILRARNMERAAIRIQRCGRNRILRKLLIRKAFRGEF